MRPLSELDHHRHKDGELRRYGISQKGNDVQGVFEFARYVTPVRLRVIADSGEGWDHVSVSTEHRTPTWDEMEYIKRTFFREAEVAMQLHVPPTDHINIHPHCLHLWRPHDQPIPLPPKDRV